MEPYASIILSSSVEQGVNLNNEPQIRLINPILMINPEIFPTLFSMTVTIMMTGINLYRKDLIELVVDDPKGVLVFSTGIINAPDMPINSNIVLNMDLKNMKLKEEGKFLVKFYINKEKIAETVFFVQNFNEG